MFRSFPNCVVRSFNRCFKQRSNAVLTTNSIKMYSSNGRYEIKNETVYRNPDSRHLIWVDCEMTGLNIDKDRLLEIALIITDNNLDELDRLGPLVLNCEKEVLDSMNDWCKRTHTETGLTAKSLESKLTVEMVDDMIVKKLNAHSIKGGILAGNSISYDNLFIRKFLHRTVDLLHYRMLDVTSVKLLQERWYPGVKSFQKQCKHEALSDIIESINELKYYRKHILK